MGFVSKKRGRLAFRLFRHRKANILHEIYFLMFQLLIVFLVVIALFQYVNNVASGLAFEKKFTAMDLGLLTTAVHYAPGTLKHTYTTLPFPVPMDFIFADSLVNVKERGSELNMLYWFFADSNLEPLADTANIRLTEEGGSPSTFTYYKSGGGVALDRLDLNPLQLVCPIVETAVDNWQANKIFIAKVLPKSEDYSNADLPANRVSQVLSARYNQVQVSGAASSSR
jgi:hypothetical protein